MGSKGERWERGGVTSSSAGPLHQKEKVRNSLLSTSWQGIQKAQGTILELNPDAAYTADNNLWKDIG